MWVWDQIINDLETMRFRVFRFLMFRDEQSMRDAIEGRRP
nr:glycine-rich RNA-binding protein GRP1A-like [Ipomoea batatas]GMD84314.1 glycine-rich RNA-binding protein GRP1A-like [Ipomoea batatas]GME09843.1 glycine-rich RNA-binding protein GRP1A-like [Ipomoea batatas]